MRTLARHLWLMRYPLKLAGMDLQRNVTVVRLESAQVVLLSSGPFSEQDVIHIRDIGQPCWLVESMLRHDTYSREGWAAFPSITFLAPPGFAGKVHFPVAPILPPPPEWGDELQTLELGGIPGTRETVFFHAPSRTLIVEDLAFNFPGEHPLRDEILLRLAVGKHHAPGVPRSIPLQVKDRPAFEASLARMFAWDFTRVIVAHGDPLETEARERLHAALTEAGFTLPPLAH
jgi:hypothetical protein